MIIVNLSLSIVSKSSRVNKLNELFCACKSSAYSTCSSEALIISLFIFIIFKTPFFFIFVIFSISFVFENVNIKYVKKNKEQLIKVTLYYSLLLFVISFFFLNTLLHLVTIFLV